MNRALPESLNSLQQEAVSHVRGPLMIVAGAGTGKTRTLCRRVAHLIREVGIDPGKILAVTFTRRAADEIGDRIARLLERTGGALPKIGTFHSISAGILRDEIHHLGYGRNFSILTQEERLELLRELGDKSVAEARDCLARISAFKNQGEEETEAPPFYSEYSCALKQRNSLDFDDLIRLVLRLFHEQPQVLSKYRDRFQYILVDEYQDVNPVQYHFIRSLAGNKDNLCVVGDADQAIYSFRGAHVENFLNFQADYPAARVIRLEQNYRSTAGILKAADQVVSKNLKRMDKSLWTEEPSGAKIRVMEVADDKQEARWIVSQVEELLGGTSMFQHDADRVHAGTTACQYNFSDIVVLFRLRAQAGPIQRALETAGIPHRLLSGDSLSSRPGTRRLLALLRFFADPADDAALLRVLQDQIKGFGAKSAERLLTSGKRIGIPLFTALTSGDAILQASDRESRSVQELLKSLEAPLQSDDRKSIMELVEGLPDRFDLDDLSLQALKVLSLRYKGQPWKAALGSLLHDLSFIREADLYDPRAQAVNLMTMHAAKGLEFPVVFITGLEEGLMPYTRDQSPTIDEIEEERRLLHVAMTRARTELYLLHARTRRLYGKAWAKGPSPFLQDIAQTLYRLDILQKRRRPPQKEDPQLGLF